MRRNKGFSLIAVAMIIVVLGALVILSLLPISSGQHDKLIQTQNQLDEIKIALTAYAAQNSGAYPCPASFTDTTNSSTFGSQVNYTANCLSASVTSCAATPGSNILSPSTPKFFCPTTNTTTPTFNQTWIGALPVRDLGLPDSYELDGWGNRFTYVVNNNTNGFFIRKPDNTPIAGVHFHVLSHGPDGVGAYTKSGTRGKRRLQQKQRQCRRNLAANRQCFRTGKL